jgi:two-component system, NarL family, nitrate/nitrite response regulator NarL
VEIDVAISLVLKDTLTLDGLSRILVDQGFVIRQCAGSLDELPINELMPEQMLVLDAASVSDDGMEALAGLLEQLPGLKIVLLDAACDMELVTNALAAGVRGYILRSVPSKVFVALITLVALGEKVVPTEVISALPRISNSRSRSHDSLGNLYDLGEREQEILACLVLGLPNKVISRELEISEATVKATVKAIFRKMSVSNRTQAAIRAREVNGGGKAVGRNGASIDSFDEQN